jgi:hypothetical protein
MSDSRTKTFVIDCHHCKAKVAAAELAHADRHGWEDGTGEPWGERILLGTCPKCRSTLVGQSRQTAFAEYDSHIDDWSDVIRVFPKPPKVFSSWRIPRPVTDSLLEADRSLQAGANIAACVMFGRALEALCRDILLEAVPEDSRPKAEKKIMLGAGINQLKDKKIIDDRLYDWSQQLAAFRNLAAHPEDISISRNDAEDLQTFVYAIVEYVYDLADRYEEFIQRAEKHARRKKV